MTQQFNSIEKVKSLRVPALFIHGDADTLVPPAMSQALYEATPSPKQIIFILGADHNDAEFSIENLKSIQQFVEKARS